VSITVTDQDGNQKATAEVLTAPREEWGGAEGFQTRPEDWAPSQPDIQPYDFVTAQADSGQTAQVQIGDVRGTINLETDSIQGTINASWFDSEVNVECHPWGAPPPQPEMKFDVVLPDGVDPYACAWDPLTEWDIQPGQVVGVGYSGPDGHWVANTFFIPNTWLIAFPEAEQIFGYGWTEGSQVDLSINDPPDYTQTVTVGPAPWDPNDIMAFFDFGALYNLKPGDVVRLSGSGIDRVHTVQYLTITGVDAEANTVSGAADPGALVHAWIHGIDGSDMEMIVDGGTWLADFDEVGYDLQAGMCGRAEIRDEAGNSTAVDWCVN
jgi:hypothetical protein